MEWRSAEKALDAVEERTYGVWSRAEIDEIANKDRNKTESHRQRLRRELKRRAESRNGRVRKPTAA